MAHYRRMLQACGYHPGPDRLWAAVLGTSLIKVTPGQAADLVFVWHDLNDPERVTFFRSAARRVGPCCSDTTMTTASG